MIAEPRRPRILVIDDDDDARSVIADMLTLAGFYTAGLDHSTGAIDSLKAQRPDLLVLDLRMPEEDGIQVLAQVRMLGYHLPVLIVTASPVQSVPGAEALIHKPFDMDVLIGTVTRLLGEAA